MGRVSLLLVPVLAASCGEADSASLPAGAALECLEKHGGTVVTETSSVYENNPVVLVAKVEFPWQVRPSNVADDWTVDVVVGGTAAAARRLTKHPCYRPVPLPTRCTTDDHARMRWGNTVVRWSTGTLPPDYVPARSELMRTCFGRAPDQIWTVP